MKVVLLCSFSNSRIRSQLKLKTNRKLFSFLIKLFHLPARVGEYSDYAPWVPNLIEELEKHDDIELHVVTEHIGLTFNNQEFKMNKTTYHFYSSEFSSFARICDNLKLWVKLERNHVYVNKILDKIQPDIVNVVGIENPCNAVPAYYIKKYPVYVLSQTIYSNPNRLKYTKRIRKINWNLEILLHKTLTYFAVYSQNHYELLKEHNHGAIIFEYDLPMQRPPQVRLVDKKYDFVNFALVLDNRKGAHDSIKAISKLKQDYPNVQLNLVGRCDIRPELDSLIAELGLENNVSFTPFFEKQDDLFQHINKSRFAVLPCKLDVTSQTMAQAMYYGLPLVVYKTIGTPMFNEREKCVLIAELENIDSLAAKMKLLMEDSAKAEQLRVNAKEYMEDLFNHNSILVDKLVEDYYAICNHASKGEPIPTKLLYSKD